MSFICCSLPAPRLSVVLISALFVPLAMPAGAAEPVAVVDARVPLLSPVVVTGSRVEHSSFDLPAAIDVVDRERITEGQARVNASEALVAVPGITVQNRQNYAQDLQISSRGFGARSAFGVRGIKLIADGIPASMPDGQGQAATFNLDQAERIEVLRGPFSAVYGNNAGGVIQLFTREGKGAPSIETSVVGGSYGTWKADVSAQGKSGNIGYVLDVSRFATGGYRDHSAATRDQSMAKLNIELDADSRLTVVANQLSQHDTQDALGVKWGTFRTDPRKNEIDTTDTQNPKRTLADRYNTRKSIDHVQGGATYERRFGEDRLQVSAYAGNRKVVQYQSFSKGFQAPASHPGGVVDFDRDFGGVGARWIAVRQLGAGSLTTTAGVDYDRSTDNRRGYENFVGTQFGVKGALRRNEQDIVSSLDPYLQTEWQSGKWNLTAGLRHSRVSVSVDDKYVVPGNGNDSGSVNYSNTTPMLGVLYKATTSLNLYASAARGFETPTLNEMFYSGTGGTFNFKLQPARSNHLEVGAKAFLGNDTRANLAFYQVRTEDELVVDGSASGRTSYKNAGHTLRRGVELSLDTVWRHGFSGRVAVTGLNAIYDESFTTGAGAVVPSGNKIPGVPTASFYGELAWKDIPSGLSAAFETVANGKVHVSDSNTDQAAPGYMIANLRVGAEQKSGHWRLREFVRLNNIFDRSYVGSVIVGDTNKRYYEAAPGSNWLAGASAQYLF